MGSLTSGTMAGAGSFRCEHCGYMLTLAGADTLSDCPDCGGHNFVRASLFGVDGLGRGRITGQARPATPDTEERIHAGRLRTGRASATGSARLVSYADTLRTGALQGGALSQPEPCDSDAWLQHVREQLEEPGEYLAYEDGDALKTVALTREWTRIGRSLAADVRFDDPTVSRRHALVVRQADGVRVLDDRSLNGVFVNGSRIEWKVLQDGDEILVGRYRLRFLSVPAQLEDTRGVQTLHGAG
jgi:predicted  nucleic acid-binding Zn-ribbon protein